MKTIVLVLLGGVVLFALPYVFAAVQAVAWFAELIGPGNFGGMCFALVLFVTLIWAEFIKQVRY